MPYDTLAETTRWFQEAFPTPNSKVLHTQLGVHFEEINEMLMPLSTKDYETSILIDAAKMALHALSLHLKASDNVIFIAEEDREEFLDGLCDQIVTATGCAHQLGFKLSDAMNEVNRSNFSKFDIFGDPIFNPNMKVMKGPDYTKPNLSPFV